MTDNSDLWDLFDEEAIKAELRKAYAIALGSPDPSTQNGAIVYDDRGNVIGTGCNEFTRGTVVTDDLLERPKKYAFIEHAERNAIFDSFGTTVPYAMVCPWASCADCARAIVQSGIRFLFRHSRGESDRWNESIEWGDQMMLAAGVTIVTIQDPIGGCEPIRFNGELWTP